MTPNEYQQLAARTDSQEISFNTLIAACMGLVGETGEVVDHVKKVMEQGHTLDTVKIEEELGDLMWYIAKAARNIGTTLEEIAEQNIAKLQRWYPSGFSSEASRNREDTWHD